jgi:broad specificity phosphatase PhoE
MKFTLVRHGEVEPLQEGIDTGPTGPALSMHGRREATAMAKELLGDVERGSDIEALYSSPMRAARVTADALSAVLGVGDPLIAPELSTLTPEVLPEGHYSALEAVQERAWNFLLDLKEQYEQRSTVVLVTHELTIRALVCRALEMQLADMYRFDLAPASMTTIEFRLQRDRERTLIAALNDTCHLAAT